MLATNIDTHSADAFDTEHGSEIKSGQMDKTLTNLSESGLIAIIIPGRVALGVSSARGACDGASDLFAAEYSKPPR